MCGSALPAVCLCLLLVISHQTNAQIKSHDLGLPGLFFTNMIEHNDTLVISGIISRGDTFTRQDIILILLDTNGVVIDHFIYHDSLNSDYAIHFGGKSHGMIMYPDNSGFLILGHASQRGNGIVMKVGKDGRQLWVKEYPDFDSSTEVFSELVKIDGGFLVAGRKQNLGTGLSDIFVIKIDSQGNKLWEKKYDEDNGIGDYFGDILMLNANEIVIAGSTSPGDVPVEEKDFISKIFAIDSLGEIKWYWESNPSLNETVRGLNHDSYGNWHYVTIFVDYISENSFRGMPRFIKRDSSFNLIVERDLDDADAFYNYLVDMTQLSDGGFLGTGVNWEEGDPFNHSYAWMIRLDAQGDVMWERKDLTFPEPERGTRQFLHSAVELPSGNIIASGYYYTPSDPKEYGILIKVDRDGCIDTLCTTTSLMEMINRDIANIFVYPNPARDNLTFDLDADIRHAFAELYDLTGRKLFRKAIHGGETTIAIENIPAGIVAWRVMSEKGQLIGQGKVVISD